MFLHQQSPRCSSPAMIDLRIKALTDGWMANIIICAAFSSPAEDELQLLPSISFFQVIFILQFPLTPKRVKDRSISFQFQPGRGRGCLLPPPARACPRSSPSRAGARLAGYRSLPGKCCSPCPDLLLTCHRQRHWPSGLCQAEKEFLPSKRQRVSQPGWQPASSATAILQQHRKELGINPDRRRVSPAHVCTELCLVSAALFTARWDSEDGSGGHGTQIKNGIPSLKHHRPTHLWHSTGTVPLNPH